MQKIKQLEKEMMRLDLPGFAAGDTVKVHVKIKEGEKERIQVFHDQCHLYGEKSLLRCRGGAYFSTPLTYH
jgi:ribosomal protein L19